MPLAPHTLSRPARPGRNPGRPLRRAPAAALAALLVATLVGTSAPAAAQTQAAAPARQVVTSAEQLPRRSYALPRLPSELVAAPLAEVLPLAQALEKDLLADLASYDIRDSATLRSLAGTRLSIALLRSDWAAVPALAAELRALQDKPAGRATAGVLSELLAQVKTQGGDAAAQSLRLRALVGERYGAMPWAEVQDALKALKGQMEVASPALVIGGFKAAMDDGARNAGMKLDGEGLAAILGARAAVDQVLPLREAVVAGLAPIIDQHRAAARPDRWSERLVTLAPDAKAAPVVVGIWDTGVDMALFKPAPVRGIAFDDDGRSVDALLRPLGEAQPRWPQLRALVKGGMDLRAAIDSDEARALKAKLASLAADDVKAFGEDMALAGLYVHGTHVAGIAVAGNPFAQVLPVSQHWSHRSAPDKPTDERSQRVAEGYRQAVDTLKAAGARVVNMSWRYGPGFHEEALAHHGVGRDGEERKRMAARLFALERDALKAAIAAAPGILFVAGAGNEDNSADFVEYIPAGLELPNLITAGAVDQAGEETSFSSFGRTVVVHANGFRVDSLLPGGDRMALSGTSMAAPQVTNLAAKLFALQPALTPAQAKAIILGTAERRGRVNLLNPKAALAPLAAAPARTP